MTEDEEFVLKPKSETEFKAIKKFLDKRTQKYDPTLSNMDIFRIFCELFYLKVKDKQDLDRSWISVYEIIANIKDSELDIKKARNKIRSKARHLDLHSKLRRKHWEMLLKRKEGDEALYRPAIIKIDNPDLEDPHGDICGLDKSRYNELIEILKRESSGLIVPKTEEGLRNCFDTLRDFQVEVVPRKDAKFLAKLVKENDFKIVVEGPAMVGKSTFAYLVAKEWLKKVGIVQGTLNEADLDLIRKKDFLVILDVGDLNLLLGMDFHASLRALLHSAEKLLIVRRKGEPRDRDVREALDAFSFNKDFFAGGEIEPIEKIRCELGRMENIIDVVNAIEKNSRIKVDDEAKKEICSICVSSDEKHTIVGLVKAIFIGFASLRDKGEIGDLVTLNDFERIEASKLKEYKASEKILEHIYTWLDEDVQNLLKAFKFLDEVVIEHALPKLVVEEAYRAYNGTILKDTTIEKAEYLGIIHATNKEYRVWHPWQVEIIELKKEIRPALDELIARLRSDLPYDKDKRVTLSLAKLLWDAQIKQPFKNIDLSNDDLWKESIKYFSECYKKDKNSEIFAELLTRVVAITMTGRKKSIDNIQRLKFMFCLFKNDEIREELLLEEIKVYMFRFVLSHPELVGANDPISIKAWLDFAHELVIEKLEELPMEKMALNPYGYLLVCEGYSFTYYILCLQGILDNPDLILEAKEFWIKYINKIAFKTITDEIAYFFCVNPTYLIYKEIEFSLKNIIDLAKKRHKKFVQRLKEEHPFCLVSQSSPENKKLLENCLTTI